MDFTVKIKARAIGLHRNFWLAVRLLRSETAGTDRAPTGRYEVEIMCFGERPRYWVNHEDLEVSYGR